MNQLHDSLFEAVLNATDAGIVVYDRYGKVRTANETARSRARIGYGVDLSPGASIYDIVLPADRAGFDSHTASCLAGESVAFIKRLSLPKQPDRHYRFAFRPVSEPGEAPWGVCLSVQDVEPQLTMEEQLEVARYVIDQSPASVVITDTEGRIEYVNPRFSQLTGYSAEEVLGKNPRILNSGEQDRAFYADLWKTIAAGRRWHGEFRNRRKDGRIIWEEAYIQAIVDSESRIKHFIAIKEDIGDRKRAEAEMKSLLVEKDILIQELYHRTRNNLQTINALLFMELSEQGPRSVDEFAKSIECWVFSLAMVQEELYKRQNLSEIGLRSILESIINHTIQGRRKPAQNVDFALSMPDQLVVPLEVANALGLAIQELAARSIDAFPGSLDIRLEGSHDDDALTLAYSVKLPSGLSMDERSAEHLDRTLAASLVSEQLRGTFEVRRNEGISCAMTIPIARRQSREAPRTAPC